MALNFVKFSRGSAQSYENLKRANRLESDALYFIYDKNNPEDGGLLYLGEVLIGGTGLAGATKLSELTDIDPSKINNLSDGMILHYNGLSEIWEPINIATALENANISIGGDTYTGINVDSTTMTGSENLSGALARVNQSPTEGDIVFVNNIPYIFNGTSWQKLVGTNLDDRVTTLENKVSQIENNIIDLQNGLTAVDGKIAAAISNANHLTYQIQETLPVITDNNVGDLNNSIILVRNSNESGDNLYDEYMVINGSYEKMNTIGLPTLDGYVTTQDLNTAVSNLNTSITAINNKFNDYVLKTTYATEVGNLATLAAAVEKESTTIVDEIIELNERLQWAELDP